MLTGELPFIDESIMDTIELITQCKLSLHEEKWGKVSRLCKDLLLRLLNPQPTGRLSAECKNKLVILFY